MSRIVPLAVALLVLPGCGLLPAYLDVGGGGVAGASEPTGFGAGPVLSLALGVAFDVEDPEALQVGIGAAGDAAWQDFDRLDRPIFLSGIALDVAVPFHEVDPGVHVRWHAMLTAGGAGFYPPGAPMAERELTATYGGSVFSGVGLSVGFGVSTHEMLSFAIGPYGLFLGAPGAYGGGMLRLRFSFYL